MNYFKTNLIFLTKNGKLNQNQLAQKLQITRQSITTLLNTDNPRADTLIKIANIFDVSIDDLLLKDLSKEDT